jgi:hypothetical protein
VRAEGLEPTTLLSIYFTTPGVSLDEVTAKIGAQTQKKISQRVIDAINPRMITVRAPMAWTDPDPDGKLVPIYFSSEKGLDQVRAAITADVKAKIASDIVWAIPTAKAVVVNDAMSW